MRLTIVTPMSVVLDADDVAYVRAEDRSGAFGVLDRHAPILAFLGVSVVRWRDHQQREHYVAVRNAVCQISERNHVQIAARSAVPGESLEELRASVLMRFKEQSAQETISKTSSARLHFALIRQVQRFLEAGRSFQRGEMTPPRQDGGAPVDQPR